MTTSAPSRTSLIIAGIGALALGGATGWTLRQTISPNRAGMEQVVHDYLLAHPEILPQALDNLRNQQSAQMLTPVRAALERSWPGAVLGNPQGTVTMVEFTDYACTFCRTSLPDVDALIAANPDLKVVVRELPILSPASGDAAKMALAAAGQGKYASFRKAMYAEGRPDADTINAAAKSAGLDLNKARSRIADPAITAEIARNLDLARSLDLNGTPAWIVGDTIISGAVGRDALASAIQQARMMSKQS